jgi:hypothetical protein
MALPFVLFYLFSKRVVYALHGFRQECLREVEGLVDNFRVLIKVVTDSWTDYERKNPVPAFRND